MNLVKTVSVALLLLASAALAKLTYGSQLDDQRQLTVLISNVGMGGMGMGTGVLLDTTHVLTCFHMADKFTDDFFVYTYPFGRVIKAHIEGGNKDTDLLVLTLESSTTVKVPPVFQNNYQIGEPITVVGNALGGMQWFVTKGIISGESQGFLLTDALINPGNSGGPWFNAKGEIVALTDWRIGPESHYPGLGGGISATTINRILDARAQQEDMRFLLKLMQQKKQGEKHAPKIGK